MFMVTGSCGIAVTIPADGKIWDGAVTLGQTSPALTAF
jgi:hypothetical protein